MPKNLIDLEEPAELVLGVGGAVVEELGSDEGDELGELDEAVGAGVRAVDDGVELVGAGLEAEGAEEGAQLQLRQAAVLVAVEGPEDLPQLRQLVRVVLRPRLRLRLLLLLIGCGGGVRVVSGGGGRRGCLAHGAVERSGGWEEEEEEGAIESVGGCWVGRILGGARGEGGGLAAMARRKGGSGKTDTIVQEFP